MQEDNDAGKSHDVEIARFCGNAAHGDKNLLVGFNVAKVEMPVSHGYAGFIGRKCLRHADVAAKFDRSHRTAMSLVTAASLSSYNFLWRLS